MSWQNWIDLNEEPVNRSYRTAEHYRRFADHIGIVCRYRHPHIVVMRYIFWEDVVVNGKFSLASTGKITGHNHSTVLHGLRRLGVLNEINDRITTKCYEDYGKLKNLYLQTLREDEKSII